MRALVLMALATAPPLSVTGCDTRQPPPRRALSERQRDSTIGASQVPGARGVQGALRAADSAVARRAREDSVGREP